MKKMLGLMAVAALALMAFAGTASATTLTSPAGTTLGKGAEIKSTATSTLTLRAGFANVTCTESTVAGTIERPGGATETPGGKITTLTFGNCGSFVVTVIKKGELEIHTQGATSNGNGTVTSIGAEVTTALGSTSCTYGTPTAKSIGDLTGGTTATFAIAAELTKTAGGFLCASPAKWEGSYKVTTPDTLLVD